MMKLCKWHWLSVLLGFFFSVQAETIAWWRFTDMGTQGGQTVQGQTFSNLVDSATYSAIATAFDTSNHTYATEAAYFPTVTNVFGVYNALKVYDPLSGRRYDAAMAMRCPWGGDLSCKAGGAYVLGDRKLCGQDVGQSSNLTYECFFRTTQAGLSRTKQMQGLAGFEYGDFAAWSLVIYRNHVWSRNTLRYEEGGKSKLTNQQLEGNTYITPNVWHHAAFVFEASNSTMRLYLDSLPSHFDNSELHDAA